MLKINKNISFYLTQKILEIETHIAAEFCCPAIGRENPGTLLVDTRFRATFFYSLVHSGGDIL